MTYFGLCIGGPLDGQYHNWNTKRFETPAKVTELSDPVDPSGCDVADQTFAVTHYEHSPLRAPGTDKTFDLWLHKGLSVAEALAKLQNAYHGAKAQERRG